MLRLRGRSATRARRCAQGVHSTCTVKPAARPRHRPPAQARPRPGRRRRRRGWRPPGHRLPVRRGRPLRDRAGQLERIGAHALAAKIGPRRGAVRCNRRARPGRRLAAGSLGVGDVAVRVDALLHRADGRRGEFPQGQQDKRRGHGRDEPSESLERRIVECRGRPVPERRSSGALPGRGAGRRQALSNCPMMPSRISSTLPTPSTLM